MVIGPAESSSKAPDNGGQWDRKITDQKQYPIKLDHDLLLQSLWLGDRSQRRRCDWRHLRPGAPTHDLFEAVRQQILALGPQVQEEFRWHCVAYKTQTNFVDVVPQKHRLLLTLNMRFDELSDPRGLAADITNLGLWGNGDVQVELDNERQITSAMELVRQAFVAKQPGGSAGDRGDMAAS